VICVFAREYRITEHMCRCVASCNNLYFATLLQFCLSLHPRSREDKSANPERLSIDNRQLSACPVLEGEERLRLLNYQNNNIQAISNVANLPNLIFLDLYNNSIKAMTGLQTVTQLRVLMLGKNKISKVLICLRFVLLFPSLDLIMLFISLKALKT